MIDLISGYPQRLVFVGAESGEDAGILCELHGAVQLRFILDIPGRGDRRGGIELLNKLDEVKAFLAVRGLDLTILLDHAVELEGVGIGIIHVFRDRGEVPGNLREDGAIDVIADELELLSAEGNLHGNGEDLVNGEDAVGIVEFAGELDGALFLLVLFPVLERDPAEERVLIADVLDRRNRFVDRRGGETRGEAVAADPRSIIRKIGIRPVVRMCIGYEN